MITTLPQLDLERLLPVGRNGWLVRTPGFTAREVRRLLRAAPVEPRARAVARCAARVDDWRPPEPHIVDCPYHAWKHLARIVFWYGRGDSIEAIGTRLGSLGYAWGCERVFDVACAAIADCLNRHPDMYGFSPEERDPGHAARWGRR